MYCFFSFNFVNMESFSVTFIIFRSMCFSFQVIRNYNDWLTNVSILKYWIIWFIFIDWDTVALNILMRLKYTAFNRRVNVLITFLSKNNSDNRNIASNFIHVHMICFIFKYISLSLRNKIYVGKLYMFYLHHHFLISVAKEKVLAEKELSCQIKQCWSVLGWLTLSGKLSDRMNGLMKPGILTVWLQYQWL